MNKTYIIYMSYSMLYFLLLFICMLISVAFFTLFERKLLSYFHNRVGPNKASMMGLTQPFSDALKLLTKEFMISSKMNYSTYMISPIMMMMLIALLWMLYPTYNTYVWYLNYSVIFMLCCFSVSVYPIMLGGWSSNSSYALIGSMRGLAQTISYEVSLSIILISALVMIESMNFNSFDCYSNYIELGTYMSHLMMMLYVSSLAEVNRTPFDFVEGESELVSGFNVEYFGYNFAFIFLAEYSMIIWISGLNAIIFMPSYDFIMTMTVIAYSMVWMRASFPRMRYDELMYLCWKMFLPVSILSVSILTIFKFFIIGTMY